MGILLFSINLDNPSRQYYPGQAITGKVFLNITGDESCSEVVIHFFGNGHTHWVEQERERHTHGMGKDRRDSYRYHHYHYDGHETYFDFYVRLYGDGVNTIYINPGQNVLPFAFQVPARPLPVSCNFEDGWVQYGLEARIRKPWYKVDPKTDILPITIFTLVDLNVTPNAGNPMQTIDSKQFGCCCQTEPCIMKSFTPKLGYCPGEIIPLTVEINNHSNQQIYNLTASFKQVWTLFADGHRGRHVHHHENNLGAAIGSGVGPGQSTLWNVPGMVVPPTVPPSPNPMASDIIKMGYEIHINVSTDGCCGCRSQFGISHPVIVGNVPLLIPVMVETVNEKK